MFKLRPDHINAFQQMRIEQFKREMVHHCYEFSPHLCKTLPKVQLRKMIDYGFSRAQRYGFSNRGPIQLYLEMMLLFGSGFDTDPQYSWAQQCLQHPEDNDQMTVALELYKRSCQYIDVVAGDEDRNTRAALEKIYQLQNSLNASNTGDFESTMLGMIQKIHPLKYTYMGKEALRQFIASMHQKAITYFADQNKDTHALVVILGFSFGHACEYDPLYPWIGKNLVNRQYTPEKRAEKLKRQSLIWLEAVLENKDEYPI